MAMANRDDVSPGGASHISTTGPQVSLRNPLPLSASQEAEVKNLYYKRVRTRCGPEIKEFADCARGRTVTATWQCRAQRFAMNSCMIAHASQAEEDAAREEWFATVTGRRKQKEDDLLAVEKRRKEVIEMTKRQEVKEEEEMRRKLAEKEKEKEKGDGGTEGGTGKKKGWWG